jgi:hypothetical protein
VTAHRDCERKWNGKKKKVIFIEEKIGRHLQTNRERKTDKINGCWQNKTKKDWNKTKLKKTETNIQKVREKYCTHYRDCVMLTIAENWVRQSPVLQVLKPIH